jgi:thiol-disulfide isomerase/thioredoxin/YHS domain-containing protein
MMATTLLLYATLTLAATPSTDGIRWTAEVDEALRLSQKYHVPVLLHFSSDNCPPCRLLEQRAFKNQGVIKAVHDDYIPVLINVDKNRALAQKYSVQQWPTDILLNSDGEVIHRGVSPQDPKRYQDMLAQGVQSHKNHLALKIEAAKNADPSVVAKSKTTLPSATGSFPTKQVSSANSKLGQGSPFSSSTPWPSPAQNSTNTSRDDSQNTSAHPASIAAKVNSQTTLHPENTTTEPEATTPAPALQTFNPFFNKSSDNPPATSTTNAETANPSTTSAATSESVADANTTSENTTSASQQPSVTATTETADNTTQSDQQSQAEQSQTAQSQTAQSQTAQPQTAQPQTAQPQTAQPQTAQPTTAQPETAESQPPTLDGFCPVSLHEALSSGDFANAWQEGDHKIAIKHRSCIYWLRDEDQAQKFMANPDQYAATLSGFDLVTFVREGVLVPGKREFGFLREGRLFLFSSEKNKAEFAANHTAFVAELKAILQQRVAQETKAPTNATR